MCVPLRGRENYNSEYTILVVVGLARSTNSGGSSDQTLWGQLVDTVGPSHISYSKILLVSSKPVGPGGPAGIAYIRHCLPRSQISGGPIQEEFHGDTL
jgi:hypothetical protein